MHSTRTTTNKDHQASADLAVQKLQTEGPLRMRMLTECMVPDRGAILNYDIIEERRTKAGGQQ